MVEWLASHPLLVGVGVLAGLAWTVGFSIWARSKNEGDPLQARLAGHLDAYAQSSHDRASLKQLESELKRELKERSVPREEWAVRVAAAGGLARGQYSREQKLALVEAVERMVARL